jgi:hypothetical protein
MEDLQNLASKIDDVKEKLTDGEYKDLLELAHKYYDKEETKAKRKFVKCLTGSFKLIIDANTDDDGGFYYTGGDKFHFQKDGKYCPCEDIRINIHRNIQFRETIFEVKRSQRIQLNRKECWMDQSFHEELKKNKYKKGHDADNEIGDTGLSIIVYLHDIEL